MTRIKIAAESVAQMRALDRQGARWACYQNMALDSRDAGRVIWLHVGEGCTVSEATPCMPDTPQYGPGWKYQLQGLAVLGDVTEAGIALEQP